MSKELFNQFSHLKGAKFIGLNGYYSSTSGEIADYCLNVNISVETAKQTDNKLLKACSVQKLVSICKKKNLSYAVAKVALNELIIASDKNLNAEISERSNQSQGQTDAYVSLGNGLKLHKDSMKVHIFGMVQSKTVIESGVYKTVNSSDKTLAKNTIKKALGLRSDKFRTFIVDQTEAVKINKVLINI